MWQTILTTIAVVVAVAYASWMLMPRAGRLRILQKLTHQPILRKLATRLATREAGSVCGACAGSHGPKHPSRIR